MDKAIYEIPGLDDLPWPHLLQHLTLAEVASLRLTCVRVMDALDHHVECIKVKEDPGAIELLEAYENTAAQQHQQQQHQGQLMSCRSSLLSRLTHLRRLTYFPSGRPGPQAHDVQLELVQACLNASNGALMELRIDMSDAVSASSRSSQRPQFPVETMNALLAMHPTGWRALDLPIYAGTSPPTAPSSYNQHSSPSTPPASPLSTLIANLPPSLCSLALRMVHPHRIFSSPPIHLTSVSRLELANYNGSSAEHAWLLVTGMPNLRSLSLTFPVVLQARRSSPSTLGMNAPAPQSPAPWLSETDAAAFQAWHKAVTCVKPALGNGAGAYLAATSPFPDLELEPLPSMTFWQALSHLRSLESLSLSLDAECMPVNDLPANLTQLKELRMAVSREVVLPLSFMRQLLAIPALSSLCLEQVYFHDQTDIPGDLPAPLPDLEEPSVRLSSQLTSLCTRGTDHHTIAAMLQHLGPGSRLKHLCVARPSSYGSHLDWAACLPHLAHLESLVIEGMWALDNKALSLWAPGPSCVYPPVAMRLRHLGLLLSGCVASPSALEVFAATCSRLRSLHVGRVVIALPRVLRAWARQPFLSHVALAEISGAALEICTSLLLGHEESDQGQEQDPQKDPSSGVRRCVVSWCVKPCPCCAEATGGEPVVTAV